MIFEFNEENWNYLSEKYDDSDEKNHLMALEISNSITNDPIHQKYVYDVVKYVMDMKDKEKALSDATATAAFEDVVRSLTGVNIME